jgi:hypothetical protein
MKHNLLLIAVLALSIGASAQQARKDLKADRNMLANNYRAYPGPVQKSLTPAPKGYVPFYLSHYGRHGSRWLIGDRDYNQPVKMLQKADSMGVLTATGKDVMQKLIRIRDAAYKRDGELTLLGAQQHKGIAERMIHNFPEIFAGKTNIDAKSTVVIRCILSMENALQQLLIENPKLNIKHDASYHDMCYMNQDDPELYKSKMPVEVRDVYNAFAKKHEHPERVMKTLFSDDNFWKNDIDANRLMQLLYKQASDLQSTELRHDFTLWNIFTDDEVYDLWQMDNAWWYINYGSSPLNGGTQPYSQRNLLRKIISEADSCIQIKHPGATLRYGHDTMVMPLTCLLNLDGLGKQVADLEKLDDENWECYNIVPMASNIQFIFYRKADSKDIIFKVLRNENEATLPIKTDMAPYYHWNDFKAYFINKLDAYGK